MTKHITTAVLILSLAFAVIASAKPEYITKNPDGSVKTRGVYQVDDTGRVTKFSVYDGTGSLLYTEIPFYSPDGRLIRGDRFDSNGKLKSVVVFFDSFATILDPDGKVIETQNIEPKTERN